MNTWARYHERALLFDPVASDLPLLNVSNESLMRDIYVDNNGGWITIGVVRDPVTRLLSLYFDFVANEMGKTDNISLAESMSENVENGWLRVEERTGSAAPRLYNSIPSLADVVDILVRNMSNAPSAFHPMSSMCGMRHSPFDVLIPFETLQVCEKRLVYNLLKIYLVF